MSDRDEKRFLGMTARFRLCVPDEAMATLTITSTIGFWKNAQAALEDDKYGAWQIKAAIGELIARAEQEFYHRQEKE